MTAYGFSKRDAQRLDRTNRRVEQMPDGTGQKQPRRHRPSPQYSPGYACSASYDSGTDVLTVTVHAVEAWVTRYGSYSNPANWPEVTLSITMGTTTSVTIYRNLGGWVSGSSAKMYATWVKNNGNATGESEGIGNFEIAIITKTDGEIAYTTRSEAIDFRPFPAPGLTYVWYFTKPTLTLSARINGDSSIQSPGGTYSVSLPPSTTYGPVYLVCDYDTPEAKLDVTSAGYDSAMALARFTTDDDGDLISINDEIRASTSGVSPPGVTAKVNVGHPTNPDGLYVQLTFIHGILVKQQAISK